LLTVTCSSTIDIERIVTCPLQRMVTRKSHSNILYVYFISLASQIFPIDGQHAHRYSAPIGRWDLLPAVI